MNLLHLLDFITCLNSSFHMNGMPPHMITMCPTTSTCIILTIQLLVIQKTFTLKKKLYSIWKKKKKL